MCIRDRPNDRPRRPPIGPAGAEEDRLPPVRRIARPEARLLLVGLLHVRDKGGAARARSCSGRRDPNLPDGPPGLRQGFRGLLPARRGGWSRLPALPGRDGQGAVSYTHLTLPTIYSV